MPKCRTCNEEKNDSFFYVSKSGRRDTECKPCRLIRQKHKWKNDIEYRKAAKKGICKRLYGMSQQEADYFVDVASNGPCGICKKKSHGGLVVDHCHSSGMNRGFLCSSCNTAIGHMKDNPEIIRAAIDYLRKSKISQTG